MTYIEGLHFMISYDSRRALDKKPIRYLGLALVLHGIKRGILDVTREESQALKVTEIEMRRFIESAEFARVAETLGYVKK